MDKKIKIKLIVQGIGIKEHNYADLELPINDESSLKKTIEKVCIEGNSICSIIKHTSNCKIKLDDNIDVLELNKKLVELNELATPDEVTAVSEYLDMKKSEYENYTCKEHEGVTIDEIINKVKVKDYKFYTNKEYLDSTDEMAIYDQLFYQYENIPKILQRMYDKLDIFNRFEIREIIDLFDNGELVEHFAKNGFCIVTTTGAIEEVKEDGTESSTNG